MHRPSPIQKKVTKSNSKEENRIVYVEKLKSNTNNISAQFVLPFLSQMHDNLDFLGKTETSKFKHHTTI